MVMATAASFCISRSSSLFLRRLDLSLSLLLFFANLESVLSAGSLRDNLLATGSSCLRLTLRGQWTRLSNFLVRIIDHVKVGLAGSFKVTTLGVLSSGVDSRLTGLFPKSTLGVLARFIITMNHFAGSVDVFWGCLKLTLLDLSVRR